MLFSLGGLGRDLAMLKIMQFPSEKFLQKFDLPHDPERLKIVDGLIRNLPRARNPPVINLTTVKLFAQKRWQA